MADAEAPAPAPGVRRRERRRAARRAEVLAAARAIVERDGLEGLTIARLTERVDAAVGALYRYFPGKEALLAALQVEAVAELRAALEGALAAVEALAGGRRAPRPVAALAAAAAVPLGYLVEAARQPARLRLITASLAAPEPALTEPLAREVDAALAPLLDLAAGRLAAAEAAGALAAGDARQRTHLAWAAVQGLLSFVHRDRIQPPELRTSALAGPLLETLLVGFGAERSGARAAVALAQEGLRAGA